MNELMNGRTEGWTGGTNARTGLMDGLEREMVGRTEWMEWTERLNEWTDRQTDRWNNQTDRWKSGRMDGRIDRLIND